MPPDEILPRFVLLKACANGGSDWGACVATLALWKDIA